MTELLRSESWQCRLHTERGIGQVLDGDQPRPSAKGEVVGLVGESGCGKTTLARAILGVLPAGAPEIRGGAVRFAGRDLAAHDPRS